MRDTPHIFRAFGNDSIGSQQIGSTWTKIGKRKGVASGGKGKRIISWASPLPHIKMGEKPLESLEYERDQLLLELHSIYAGSPSATCQAYRKAQEALRKHEDMTFSDNEINAFLPGELKKS